MTGDCHVRFCESRGVRFPPATHQARRACRPGWRKHPRFHLHFTPTSSSWLNLVERWFRELTDKALRRGSLPLRARPHRRRSRTYLDRAQQRPQTLRLDRHRRDHPRQSRTRPHRPRKSQLNTGHTTSEASPLTAEVGAGQGVVLRSGCGDGCDGDGERCARRACGARSGVSGSDLSERLCAESAGGRAGGVVYDRASGLSDPVAGDHGEDRHRVPQGGGPFADDNQIPVVRFGKDDRKIDRDAAVSGPAGGDRSGGGGRDRGGAGVRAGVHWRPSAPGGQRRCGSRSPRPSGG